jgi:hypothetical protein
MPLPDVMRLGGRRDLASVQQYMGLPNHERKYHVKCDQSFAANLVRSASNGQENEKMAKELKIVHVWQHRTTG